MSETAIERCKYINLIVRITCNCPQCASYGVCLNLVMIWVHSESLEAHEQSQGFILVRIVREHPKYVNQSLHT